MIAGSSQFLCPRCRAGFYRRSSGATGTPCGGTSFYALGVGLVFTVARTSWTLTATSSSIYAPGVGLVFTGDDRVATTLAEMFLCPRCRAGLCSGLRPGAGMDGRRRFYALGVGLVLTEVRRPVHHGHKKFLCPRCRAGLYGAGFCKMCYAAAIVSMPSVSGWSLRMEAAYILNDLNEFLCPRCRAGLYGREINAKLHRIDKVSMPSVSGWSLRTPTRRRQPTRRSPFLCPRCRAGLLRDHAGERGYGPKQVSMPSVSRWSLRTSAGTGGAPRSWSFYALGVGLVFTGSSYLGHLSWPDRAVCERSADENLLKPGFGGIKVRKRLLTCMRALPGLEWPPPRSQYMMVPSSGCSRLQLGICSSALVPRCSHRA